MISSHKLPQSPTWLKKYLKRGKMSPSDMGSIAHCPLQWQFRKEGRVGIEVDFRRRLLGSNIHNMIKTYFQRISNKPSKFEIERVAENVWEEKFNSRDLNSLRKRGERCWANFVSFELDRLKKWKVYKPTIVEAKKENDKYVCIADLHSDSQKTTIDWKTGRLDRLNDPELYQAKINLVVLNDLGYKTEKFLFVALYTGRVLEMPMVTEDWLEQERQKMMKMIKTGDLPKNQSVLCGWCAYILDCEFGGTCLWV